MTSKPEEDARPFLFITANVGSLFEESCEMHSSWIGQLVSVIKESSPSFIALHMQEIGGKDFCTCMGQVEDFIKELYKICSPLGYYCARAFLDQNFEVAEQFTALGSLYLIHDCILPCTQIWDDRGIKFNRVSGFEIHGDLTERPVGTAHRVRFPKDFFEHTKFSRKGFLKTRWRVRDLVFDLVNVHLFHDACNLTAMETPTSIFANMRRKGLRFVLQSLSAHHKHHQDDLKSSTTPQPAMFLFGDFNFRLDSKALVERITFDASDIKKEKSADAGLQCCMTMTYKRDKRENDYVLRIQKKRFDYEHHEKWLHMDKWKTLLDHDNEANLFPQLHEFPLHFPPSYPWTEDPRNANTYMKTRPPAWCDRVLMNDNAWSISHFRNKDTVYNSMGMDVCMGDHKPVYLLIKLPTNGALISKCVSDSKQPLRLPTPSPNKFKHSLPSAPARLNEPKACTSTNDEARIKELVLSLKPSYEDWPQVYHVNLVIYTVSRLQYDFSGSSAFLSPDSFVSIVTLHDDNTVSVLDASSYGMSNTLPTSYYGSLDTLNHSTPKGFGRLAGKLKTYSLESNDMHRVRRETTANRNDEYSSIITIEGETGEAEVVFAKPRTLRTHRPRSQSISSSGSLVASPKRKRMQAKSPRPMQSLERRSIDHSKRCQTDPKFTNDTNTLANELLARKKKRKDLGERNILRENVSVQMWTMAMLRGLHLKHNEQNAAPPNVWAGIGKRVEPEGAEIDSSKNNHCSLM